MKGGVFTQWLKEFCALVFTQTVQAFILAIILVLIATTFEDGAVDNSIKMNAAGILSIIALTSISKMEELVKKLFGLNSSITDTSMKGGVGNLASAWMMMKMIKSLGDNIPKVLKGGANAVKSTSEKRRLEAKRELELRDLEKDNSNNSQNLSQTGTSSQGGTNGAGGVPFGPVGPSGTGGTGGINGNIGNITVQNMRVQNSNVGNGTSNKDFESKKNEIISKYDEKIEKAKENRRAGIKDMASGVAETGLAVGGAGLGTVVGAGLGTDLVKAASAGAIIGDKIGQATLNIASETYEVGKQIAKTRKEIAKLDKKIDAGNI